MADDRLDPETAGPCSRRCRRGCSLHSSSTPSIGDISVLAHISEIRAQLEPLAARRAAERAIRGAQPDLEELAAHIEQLDVTQVDQTELMRWDLAVHRAIYRAAGNPRLEDVLIR